MMSLMDIITLSGHNIASYGVWLCILMMVVQVSPIKINPWTWIIKKIGHAMNGELIRKVDEIERQMGEDRAVTARVRILAFNDELLQGQKHSKESFDQCLDDITHYSHYCQKHKDFENERTVLATKNIAATYERCMRERSFL